MITVERAKRLATHLALAACSAVAFSQGAKAADTNWPTRPITFVVTYAAGGGADLMARLLANKMSQTLGQPILVENRPGGGAGQIGAAYVARSAPDGYTVMVDAGGYSINPGLYPKLPYDPLKAFTTIGVAALFPHVLVTPPTLPVNSVADVISLSHKKPLFFASSGIGSTQHIAAVLFMESTGTKLTHVPYKGGGPAMVDVMGGQIPLFFGNIASTLPNIQSGKLKALAIAGSKRIPAIPNVPTMQELGIKGTEIYEWNGMFVPSATPAAIVDRLSDAMDKALKDPEIVQRITALGGEPFQGGRVKAAQFVESEIKRMTEVVHRNKLKVDE